jgi:hypothetical protein
LHTAVVEGQWDAITNVTSGTSKYAKSGSVFTDVRGPKEEVNVAPLEEQGEWETRKLWEKVANGIRTGDFDTASKEKTKIEVRFLICRAIMAPVWLGES